MGEYIIAKYIRLSIEDAKSDSMSIENQRLLLNGHLEALNTPNCKLLEFVDNGYTGTNFERPQVQELLQLAQTGGVNCIVVKDFSRFGRNSIEMGYFLERVFPLCHVRFISVDDHYDSAEHDGDTGGIGVAFKFLVHEQYSKDLSRKITASKHEKMRRGEAIYRVFGYNKIGGKLIVDDLAADTVQRIYTLALEGKNYGQIAEVMYAEKRKTPAAHKSGAEDYIWSKQQILKILRDEQYIGTYVAGKSRTVEIGSGKQIKIPKENWIRIESHHPTVVGKEIFDAVQLQLDSRSVPLRGRKISTNQRYSELRISPLKGKVFCAACGHMMRLSMTKNSAFHCHYTLAATDANCHKLKIDAKELERIVLHELREQAAASNDDEEFDIPQTILRYHTDIASLEDKKRVLYERFVEGAISREDFKSRNVKLTAEIAELQHIQTAIEFENKMQSAVQFGGTPLEQATLALKGRRTLTEDAVASCIDKVKIYSDGRIEVDWKT